MNFPTHFKCQKCKNDMYGDDPVFDLNSEGLGWVCENCFLEHVSQNDLCSEEDLENYGWSGQELARKINIYCTTTEFHLDNEYDLMLEEKAEARREMYL